MGAPDHRPRCFWTPLPSLPSETSEIRKQAFFNFAFSFESAQKQVFMQRLPSWGNMRITQKTAIQGSPPNKLKELLPSPNKNRDANQRKRSKAQSKIASTQTQERHQALPGKRLKTTLGRKAGRRLNLITEDQPAAGRTLPWCARFGLTGDSSHYIAHVTDSPVLKTARFRTNCNVRFSRLPGVPLRGQNHLHKNTKTMPVFHATGFSSDGGE